MDNLKYWYYFNCMKVFVFLSILFLSGFQLYGQNELAVIKNSYWLDITGDELLDIGHIDIINNPKQYKISSFTLVFCDRGFNEECFFTTAYFGKKMKKIVDFFKSSNQIFFFHNIIAKCSDTDSILLNSITIQMCKTTNKQVINQLPNIKPTINGCYNGFINKSSLSISDSIELLNNYKNLRIKKIDWKIDFWGCSAQYFDPIENSNIFDSRMQGFFRSKDAEDAIKYIYLYKIIAIDKDNREFILPSIVLKVNNNL